MRFLRFLPFFMETGFSQARSVCATLAFLATGTNNCVRGSFSTQKVNRTKIRKIDLTPVRHTCSSANTWQPFANTYDLTPGPSTAPTL